jgi:uncharacterized damage-inducible protein DinB
MSHESEHTGRLLAALDQGRRLLGGLDAEVYRRSPRPLAQSTVGAHFRHVLDAVDCLTRGCDGGAVDYDARVRDEAVETDLGAALRRLDDLAGRLAALGLPETHPLRVRADAPGAAAEDCWTDSTLGRELLYVMSHTIHHYALVAMILRHLGVETGEGFGVAPSTLSYWKEVGRCAPLVG